MSKKLKDLHWQPVALEGFPITSSDSFQGFVGLEECTDYGLDKESKNSRKKAVNKSSKEAAQSLERSKKKRQKKRKSQPESHNEEVPTPSKKVKLSNGFIVESCTDCEAPSNTNSVIEKTKKKQKKMKKNKKKQEQKSVSTAHTNSAELASDNKSGGGADNSVDMSAWAEYRLQEPLLGALAAQGFTRPTHVQHLILPAAIHGRRDILAAAETGSGKTLAFGLPILSGILKLKEAAAATGHDVIDIPYRKAPANSDPPRQQPPNKLGKSPNKNSNKHLSDKNKRLTEQKTTSGPDKKHKESSEDGYSSADHTSEDDTHAANQAASSTSDQSTVVTDNADDADCLEEIQVPVRKRDTSTDDGNDSDDDNYIHLSEMLDSDDLADDSDDGADEDSDSGEGGEKHGSESESEEESGGEDTEEEDVILGGEDEDVVLGDDTDEEQGAENTDGLGCVRVVDNVESELSEEERRRPLFALVVTPTRELALQVWRALAGPARAAGLRAAAVVGGMAQVKQERVLRARPELVVGTVGRLWELVAQGHPHLQRLERVKFLAVDEADRMLERGHFHELHRLLERLNASPAHRAHRQTFVLSATLTMVHELPAHMRRQKVTRHGKLVSRKLEKMTPQQKLRRLVELIGMTEPKVVDITAHNLGTAASLTECRVSCAAEDKDAHLYYLVRQHPGRTIVFCNSIGCVRRLTTILSALRCQPLPLHASMAQRQRLRNLERFRDQPAGLLVATDVAARGLDIPAVDHVIQYQVPRTAENYVHRAGRTARAHREGLNVLLVEPAEHPLYARLCRTLRRGEGEVPPFPVAGSVLAGLRALVAAARAVDALELRLRRARAAAGWRARAARDMDLILDDDDHHHDHDLGRAAEAGAERALKARRRELAALLARPLLPTNFSFKFPSLNAPPAPPAGSAGPDSALQVMKRALTSGQLTKDKRTSKNAALLRLGRPPRTNDNNKQTTQ